MAKKTFGVGSVVQLASGGPKMTITKIYVDTNRDPNHRDIAVCGWFDNENAYNVKDIPVSAVVWID